MTETLPVRRSMLPIGAPPRRRDTEAMPDLPPLHASFPLPSKSSSSLTLAPPRRPSETSLALDPGPSSVPISPAVPDFAAASQPSTRPRSYVAAAAASAPVARSGRAPEAAARSEEIFTIPPPPKSPEPFDLDEVFSVPPSVPLSVAPVRAPAPRAVAAPTRSLARVAPATGNSTYASLPPLRESAHPASVAPAERAPVGDGEGDGETALEGSDRALAAQACMRALARASRSYLIYDPSNQAVRGFLDALRSAFADYLAVHGDLPLTVRPFELVLDDEVVYVERERERSLALKLFRDGVRKLTLDADTTWQELTKLLEILSIRFVGVRQDEDDLVTLLWKAGFHHISIESIEGFVPDDGDEEVGRGDGAFVSGELAVAASARVPADFDLPAPELPPAMRVERGEVSEEARAALIAECASPRLPQVTIDLVRLLLAAAGDPTDPLSFDEVAPLVREARDFLLSDSRLAQLRSLFDVIARFAEAHPAVAPQVEPIVAGFFDARALQKLVCSVPNDAPAAPPELKALLGSLPYDPLPVLLDLLGTERAENDRRILRELLSIYLPARVDVVVDRLRASRGSLAADLLRTLAESLPDAPSIVASTLVSGEDDELQLEFLRLTASARTDASTRGVLVQLLRSPSELLRVRTVEAIGDHREPGAFTLLRRHAELRATERSSPEEMAAVGRAMCKVDAERSLEAFREWARPQGILERLTRLEMFVARARAAAAGLAMHPADEAAAMLWSMAKTAPSEFVRMAAEQAIAERGAATVVTR